LSEKGFCVIKFSGQAKTIAETLNDEAMERGYDAELYCISKNDKEFS